MRHEPLAKPTSGQLAALYRLTSELFLSPEHRRREEIDRQLASLKSAPAAMADPVREFLASPRSNDADEYVMVLELTPPCPLYLGDYMFDEPSSCRGAGFSGRNGYMIELAGAYRHFGFEIGGGELADYIPAMVEFLAISLDYRDRDQIGLRRRFVERYVRPGLTPMREKLGKYDSPYQLLVGALEAAVTEDIALHADAPVWVEPTRIGKPPTPPIITFGGKQGRLPAGEPT